MTPAQVQELHDMAQAAWATQGSSEWARHAAAFEDAFTPTVTLQLLEPGVRGDTRSIYKGIEMNDWRFRTNWMGQLILQRQFGIMYPHWLDASASDIKDYYAELNQLKEKTK